MKYLLIIVLALSFVVPVNAQEDNSDSITTYYLIRHAEKDRSDKSNRNPNLKEEGLARATNWSKVFENIKFDAVYSTNYNRTMQTAKPTAESQEMEIQTYDPRNFKIEDFVENTKGKTVLIVGHSNTTPMMANAILGEQKYKYLDDNDNGSLFIITVTNEHKIDQVLKIN